MPLRPRKRLGQHFLHDPAVIAKLVSHIDPAADDCMVEIGGGRGALTRPLLEKVRRLHVIEVDTRLAEKLETTVERPERLTMHRDDALQFDFSSLVSEPGTLRVVGNLPYNISTPLLFHLLNHRAAIRDMHLMLQREVAERVAAAPGSKIYGRLTVMLAPWIQVRTCFHVGPGAFSPPPRVRSTVVQLVPRPRPLFDMARPQRSATLVARASPCAARPWQVCGRGLTRREMPLPGCRPLDAAGAVATRGVPSGWSGAWGRAPDRAGAERRGSMIPATRIVDRRAQACTGPGARGWRIWRYSGLREEFRALLEAIAFDPSVVGSGWPETW